MNTTDSRTDTRASLIEAGLHLFGHNGFEGTSTRQLATRAGTNIASIAYHFGSKAGLRQACALAVVERLGQVMDAAGVMEPPADAAAALARIETLASALVHLIVGSPAARDMVAFMLREVADTADVADAVYSRFIEPRHKAFCALWATATGRDAEDDTVKLAVFSLLGQIVYFRIASVFVVRRMAWDAVGPDETRRIASFIVSNVRDLIERQRL